MLLSVVLRVVVVVANRGLERIAADMNERLGTVWIRAERVDHIISLAC